jgi:hypothetical protein
MTNPRPRSQKALATILMICYIIIHGDRKHLDLGVNSRRTAGLGGMSANEFTLRTAYGGYVDLAGI